MTFNEWQNKRTFSLEPATLKSVKYVNKHIPFGNKINLILYFIKIKLCTKFGPVTGSKIPES